MSLLSQFRDEIYNKAFPDKNEREDLDEVILKRITDKVEKPSTQILLGLEGEEVVCGLVTDWYESCKCLEIIYIAVKAGLNGKGLGKELVTKGTHQILKHLGRKAACVFAEVENPMEEQKSIESIDPVSRLKFFDKCNAGRIPISYVQPPLDKDKEFADNLFLICFPDLSSKCKTDDDGTRKVPKALLSDFIKDFYEGLKENCEGRMDEYDRNLSEHLGMIEGAADDEDCVALDPLVEKPHFKLSTVSVAAHYHIDGIPEDSVIANTCKEPCDYFYSYESDLLNYRYQRGDRPIYSHHAALQENVCIMLPRFYKYTSEGITFYSVTERLSLQADVSVNWSYEANSGRYIAHLVISPCYGEKEDTFTELDIIRFITGYGSLQEHYSCISYNGTKTSGPWEGFGIIEDSSREAIPENAVSFKDWLKQKMEPLATYSFQGTGICDLDLSGLKKYDNGELCFKSFDQFTKSVLNEKGPDEDDMWNKAFCGIILGIFDFERMNGPEIFDTVQPIVRRKASFCVLCRGNLLRIMYSKDYKNEKDEDLLMSPYLLIPSAALAFNERLLAECTRMIETVNDGVEKFKRDPEKGRDKKYHDQKVSLQRSIHKISDMLDDQYLRNIFQYVSEQDILRIGGEQRGLEEMKAKMLKRLDALRDIRDSYQKEYENGQNTNENMILFVLAILQVVTGISTQNYWLLPVSFALIAGAYIYGRSKVKRGRKEEE